MWNVVEAADLDNDGDVTFSVEGAILGKGLVIDHISHTGDMLSRTANDVGSVYLEGSTTLYQPMDLELDPSTNKLWFSTTNNFKGTGGGTIFASNSGVTGFIKKYTIEGARRTELEIASNGTIYALAAENPVTIIKSTDRFNSAPTVVTLPSDADGNITADDFTRGQSFYDLLIESDPNNPNAIFAGGIDLFKSTTGAENGSGANPWNQLSHWYAGFGQAYAHADQHGVAFGNSDSSKKVFGNDGGVYFSKTQSDGSELISSRVKNYVTSQFYTVGVAPSEMFKDLNKQISGNDLSTRLQSTLTINGITDVFLAGAQDNGTQLLSNKNNSISRGHDVSGGDGAASMFSQNLNKRYFVTNYVYNQYVDVYSFDTNQLFQINSESTSNGDFITVQALDSKLGVIYSNYTNSGNYEIAAYYGWDDFKQADRNTNAPKIILTSAQMLANVSALTVSPFGTDTSTLMVGLENGSVFRVENANSNAAKWTNISGNEFLGSVSDIEFGINENEIFVTFHNYAVKNIFYSSDGGKTWSNKEGDLPDLPVRSVLQNPIVLNEVIIGTDLGIWYTKNFKDESPTWIQGFNGMSDVRITAKKSGIKIHLDTYDNKNSIEEIDKISKNKIINSYDFILGPFIPRNINRLSFNLKSSKVPIVSPLTSKKIEINESGEISFKITLDENAVAKTYPLQIIATAAGQSIDPVGISLEVLSNDYDNDGIKNAEDNCPNTANAGSKRF